MTRDSSREAYSTHSLSGGVATQEQKVLDYLQGRAAASRREIARAVGMDVSSVAGRVNGLVKQGRIQESQNLYPCPVTARRVHMLRVPR